MRVLLIACMGVAACDARDVAPKGQGKAETSERVAARALRADSVVIAAGDIASCDSQKDELTAEILDTLPGTVLTAGDNVYPYGTPDAYRTCFDPTWGRHVSRMRTVPGDHETSDAYFEYFGSAAGPDRRGYYSFDQAGWHFVMLDTNLDLRAGSAQSAWLRRDLERNRTRCAAAVMHVPPYSSSAKHGNSPEVDPIWRELYTHGVDIVLAGHSHLYERFPPLDADGRPDARGMRLFIVGTGGRYLHSLEPDPHPRSEVRSASSFGVLMLRLRPGGYAWRFVPAAGSAFRDAGSAACRA